MLGLLGFMLGLLVLMLGLLGICWGFWCLCWGWLVFMKRLSQAPKKMPNSTMGAAFLLKGFLVLLGLWGFMLAKAIKIYGGAVGAGPGPLP